MLVLMFMTVISTGYLRQHVLVYRFVNHVPGIF